MDRRAAIKAMSYGAMSAVGGIVGWQLADIWHPAGSRPVPQPAPGLGPEGQSGVEPIDADAIEQASGRVDPLADEGGVGRHVVGSDSLPSDQASYLQKIRDFDQIYPEDIILGEDKLAILKSTARRLNKAQRVIGHGHFNLLSLDNLVKYCRRYSSIGKLTQQELDFLEELFFADATDYGFYGEKVQIEITATVPQRDAVKIANTGHFLFRGEAQAKYEKMCKDLDDGIFLTSGIRNVVKQMQLFLDKAVTTDGNLSQASRSLAPPGYSFHAVGDFDIGKVGAGLDNFNEVFAETDEYKKLVDLGYVELRYTPTNPFGVRHEPWHIKMQA